MTTKDELKPKPRSELLVVGFRKLVEYKSELMLFISVLLFIFSVKIYFSAKQEGRAVTAKSNESKFEMSSVGSSPETSSDIANQFQQSFEKAEAENGSKTR
jgi:hypothetical protein